MLRAALLLIGLLADVIHLKDGRVWQGEVVEEQPDRIKVKLARGAVWVPRADIERIESAAELRNEYRERAAAAATAEDHAALAQWCRERDLAGEARAEWEAAVRLDPEHAAARAALGHVKHGGRWMTEEEAARAQGLEQFEGEWVTPLRREVLGLLAGTAAEDLVERGRARKALAKLGVEGEAELRAIAGEAHTRLAEALSKENAVRGELEARAKAARGSLVALVENEQRFPSRGASDEALREMRERTAELARIGEDPAGAYAGGDEALSRLARRLQLADAALEEEDRWKGLCAAARERLGQDGVFRGIDPFRTLRAKADAENAAAAMGDAERALLDLIGTYRLRCGRAPLRWESRLEECARQHSQEMRKLGYFSHVSPVAKYSTLVKRVALVKFKSDLIGENLALGDDPAEVILQAFLDSPGHHRNLLVDRYTRVAIAKDGEYWTVNFGGDPE